MFRFKIFLFVAAIIAASCATEPPPKADPALIAEGIRFLEANEPTKALQALDSYLAVDSASCKARFTATLASMQLFVHDIHRFNKGIFSFVVDEFDEYVDLKPIASISPQATKKTLIEQFLFEGLLKPIRTHLAMAINYSAPVTETGCEIEADVPLRFILGTGDKYDLRLGAIWGSPELALANTVANLLQGITRILTSLDLEVSPLTLLDVYNQTKKRGLMGIIRSLGAIPAKEDSFMNWSPLPERAALFPKAVESFSASFAGGHKLGRIARQQLIKLEYFDDERVLSFFDTDDSATMSPGDRFVINLGGIYKDHQEIPVELRPIELRVREFLDPRPLDVTDPESGLGFKTLDKTLNFVRNAQIIFAGKAPVGTRIRIEELNGLFQAFGGNRPFEDVLEWDPNTFFKGRPLGETFTRAWPDGVTEGSKELLIVSGSGYPDPPNPAPIRSMLPWAYHPDYASSTWEFAIEGEKSLYYETRYMLPPWLNFGDFDHFFFDEVPSADTALQGKKKVTGLRIPYDCVRAPDKDTLGLVTIPYVALRDPTLGGSLYTNIRIISGGDCSDDTPERVIWNQADHYSFNKVLAHFVARFGLYLYEFGDLFSPGYAPESDR